MSLDAARRVSVAKRVSLRIIVSFLLCMLPLLAANVYLNEKSKNIILDNTNVNLQTKIAFTNDMLNQVIYNIMYQSAALTNDSLLQRYAIMQQDKDPGEYEITTMKNQIQNRAVQLHTINPLIDHVSIYFPRSSSFFTTGKNKDDLLTNEDLLHLISAFDNRYLNPPITFYNNKISLILWSNDYLSSRESSLPSIICRVELSSAQLLNSIKMLSDYANSYFILYSGDKFLVSTNPAVKSVNDLSALDLKQYSSFNSSLSTFNIELLYLVPNSSLIGQLKSYQNLFLLIFGITFMVIGIFTIYIYKLLYKPFTILSSAFDAIQNNNFSLKPGDMRKSLFSQYYRVLNDILQRLKNDIQEILNYKLIAREARMRQLQSNMQPHFLYNSLFNISCLCRNGENEQAAEMIEKLSNLFRFITKDENEYINLGTELTYARFYTDIQQMRFANRVTVTFDELPEAYGSCCVPRLILQPFLENAYNYAFSDCLEGGLLEVHFEKTEKSGESCLAVTVENNGSLTPGKLEEIRRGFFEKQETDGAMKNVNARLKLFYGSSEDLELGIGRLGGLAVRFYIYPREYRR